MPLKNKIKDSHDDDSFRSAIRSIEIEEIVYTSHVVGDVESMRLLNGLIAIAYLRLKNIWERYDPTLYVYPPTRDDRNLFNRIIHKVTPKCLADGSELLRDLDQFPTTFGKATPDEVCTAVLDAGRSLIARYYDEK